MYAVAGVSGNTGRWVAQTLLEAGEPVRVIVRDAAKGQPWADRGAEVAVADLSDADALATALDGVEGLYVLIPPQHTDDPVKDGITLGQSVARAASRTGVHVVLLSSMGAQHPSGTGPIQILHHTEAALRGAGVDATFLRAGYFFENFGALLPAINGDGVVPTFIPASTPLPVVTVRDIGRKAAALLRAGGDGVKIVGLIGAGDPTTDDIAAGFSQALGRPVTAVEQPLDAVIPTFEGMGLSPAWARLYDELYRGMRSGRIAFDAQPQRGSDGVTEGVAALLS